MSSAGNTIETVIDNELRDAFGVILTILLTVAIASMTWITLLH